MLPLLPLQVIGLWSLLDLQYDDTELRSPTASTGGASALLLARFLLSAPVAYASYSRPRLCWSTVK
eukprot:scaffold22399_cov44-Attheya_sp.AAC.3